MNDDQYFLANAYLDGELTADERRIAEADPDVMSEVEQLRGVQAELRDVAPPSAAARDAAIGAAMAEFRAAPAETGSPVVPFRPRPAYAKYLAVAAAVVAVAGLGIVISQADLGGGDDDDSGADEAAVFEAVEEDLGESDEPAADADTSNTISASAGAVGEDTAEASVADEPAEEMAEEPAGGFEDDAADSAEPAEAADEPPAARVSVPADFDPDAPILDEEELGVYGAYLLEQQDLGLLGSTPNTACLGNYDILDTATFVLGDEEVPVYVGIVDAGDLAVAIHMETCVVLAFAPVTAS